MDAKQKLLQGILEGGWSGLNSAQNPFAPDSKERREEIHGQAMHQYQEALLFAEVFDSGRGPELLSILRARCVSVVHFNPEMPDGILSILSGYFRSGEANLVLYIERMIDFARKGPPAPLEEDVKATEED